MTNTLPTLIGSEKQVNWANDIRNTYIAMLAKATDDTFECADEYAEGLAVSAYGREEYDVRLKNAVSAIEMPENGKIPFSMKRKAKHQARMEMMNEVKHKIEIETSAKWYIDHRII